MKFVLLTLFLSMVMINISYGQSCHALASTSGCCSKKSSAAAYLAAQDPSIQVRKDVATGEVLYFKKSGCAYSGSGSYVAVAFDEKTHAFVNKAPQISRDAQFIHVSSRSTEAKKMDCSKMSKAECQAKMAKGECQEKAKT